MAADRERARAACELFNLELDRREPGEVLHDEVLRARRAMAWHEREIALAMEDEDDERRERRYAGWLVERKNAERVAAEIERLGIADRLVGIEEGKARLFLAFAMAFARLAGLDPESPAVRGWWREALQIAAGEQGA